MPAADHLIDQYGYDIARAVLSTDAIASLCQALKSLDHDGVRRRGGNAYAARNLLTYCDEVRERSCSDPLLGLARSTIGEGARPVKATLFDKMPDANWAIRWHQDQVIAVRVRIEVDGFGPWSIKGGVHHVEPPADVLDRVLIVRVHLDGCDGENGALRVLPGSHRGGVASRRPAVDPVDCPVGRGGALVMCPLLWHASPKADQPSHRRVLHVGFAGFELPDPLDWYERYPLDVSN